MHTVMPFWVKERWPLFIGSTAVLISCIGFARARSVMASLRQPSSSWPNLALRPLPYNALKSLWLLTIRPVDVWRKRWERSVRERSAIASSCMGVVIMPICIRSFPATHLQSKLSLQGFWQRAYMPFVEKKTLYRLGEHHGFSQTSTLAKITHPSRAAFRCSACPRAGSHNLLLWVWSHHTHAPLAFQYAPLAFLHASWFFARWWTLLVQND